MYSVMMTTPGAPAPPAAVPRVIRTHGADWQRLRYGLEKAIENGTTGTARYEGDTEMLFFLLVPWILFNIFTSPPLLARNWATS
jgi:hypothetical protein